MSGVVSTLFCAVALNHFVRPLLTREGKEFSEGTVRVLSATADTCVFFQVGLDIALTMGSDRGLDTRAEADMVGWVLLALVVSRTASIFPLAAVINFFRRDKLPWTHTVVLWHSAMRGAGSYAFALLFPGPNKGVLVDLTATVVLISVLFYATTMQVLVRALGVAKLADAHHGGAAHETTQLVPREADDSDEDETTADRSTRNGLGVDAAVPPGALSSPARPLGAKQQEAAAAADDTPFRVVYVGGARVYLPLKKKPMPAALLAINRFDAQLRWNVSGIVRMDKL